MENPESLEIFGIPAGFGQFREGGSRFEKQGTDNISFPPADPKWEQIYLASVVSLLWLISDLTFPQKIDQKLIWAQIKYNFTCT